MGVSVNGGTPKWMVKIMENPIKMDDLGYTYFRKQPYSKIAIYLHQVCLILPNNGSHVFVWICLQIQSEIFVVRNQGLGLDFI